MKHQTKKCIALSIFLSFILTACSDPKLKNPQDALIYVDPATGNTPLLSTQKAQHAYANYLKNYYSAWSDQNISVLLKDIKDPITDQINFFSKNPGWDENQQPHSTEWINDVVNNMDMQHYPNHIENAITVQGVYERIFPTEVPSYSDVHTPGAFYPFDNFQASYLAAGVPVKIIQISQDKAWDLIEVGNANYGCWVPAQNIATVNSAFIKKWQTNLGYLGVKSDNLSLTNNNIFYYKSRMGEIYPIDKISKDNISIKIAIKNINGEAEIQQGVIPQSETYILPLVTTPHNIALIANQFINKPYGWGDLYGYRDCSSTTKNIFAYFGIWLDRNSALQKDLGGTDISLENLSDSQKQKLIQQKAIPFFSLLYIPGHIVIYLGEKNNTAYVFQNMWGLRTFRPFQSQGRKIIGKTVITPITFGKEYWDVPKTVLDRVTHLIILGDTAS